MYRQSSPFIHPDGIVVDLEVHDEKLSLIKILTNNLKYLFPLLPVMAIL